MDLNKATELTFVDKYVLDFTSISESNHNNAMCFLRRIIRKMLIHNKEYERKKH